MLHSPVVPVGKTPKFNSPWTGPYVISQDINDVTYRIQEPQTKKELVDHYDRLKPFKDPPPTFNVQTVPSEPPSKKSIDTAPTFDHDQCNLSFHFAYPPPPVTPGFLLSTPSTPTFVPPTTPIDPQLSHLHPSHRLLPTYKQNPLFSNFPLVLLTSPRTRMDRDTLPMKLHLGIDMLCSKQHVLLISQKQVPEHSVNQHKPSVELNRCGKQTCQKTLVTSIPPTLPNRSVTTSAPDFTTPFSSRIKQRKSINWEELANISLYTISSIYFSDTTLTLTNLHVYLFLSGNTFQTTKCSPSFAGCSLLKSASPLRTTLPISMTMLKSLYSRKAQPSYSSIKLSPQRARAEFECSPHSRLYQK